MHGIQARCVVVFFWLMDVKLSHDSTLPPAVKMFTLYRCKNCSALVGSNWSKSPVLAIRLTASSSSLQVLHWHCLAIIYLAPVIISTQNDCIGEGVSSVWGEMALDFLELVWVVACTAFIVTRKNYAAVYKNDRTKLSFRR